MAFDESAVAKAIRSAIKGVDLDTVTAKTIRKNVEAKLGISIDDEESKLKFKTLLVEAVNERQQGDKEQATKSKPEPIQATVPKPKPTPALAPAKAKPKPEKQPGKRKAVTPAHVDDSDGDIAEDEDEALARKLDAELNPRRAARPAKLVKTPKKQKTESSGDGKRRGGGFGAPVVLSPALSQLMGGKAELPRTEVTKRIWEHIKQKGLQDPANKRTIICDEALKKVVGVDKMDMFQMTKLLSSHMKSKTDVV